MTDAAAPGSLIPIADSLGAQSLLCVAQAPQDRIDLRLTFQGCQLEDEQRLTAGHRLSVGLTQQVIGNAEVGRGKQVLPVTVVGEGARFAHQLVDDMAILNPVAALAAQTRDALQMALREVDIEMVGVQVHLHLLIAEPTVDGVGVVTHPNRTEAADLHFVSSLRRRPTYERRIRGPSDHLNNLLRTPMSPLIVPLRPPFSWLTFVMGRLHEAEMARLLDRSDAEALASDWRAVWGGLQRAIGDYEQIQDEESEASAAAG